MSECTNNSDSSGAIVLEVSSTLRGLEAMQPNGTDQSVEKEGKHL